MKKTKYKIHIGERELKIDTSNLAEQSSGNCLVQYGETMVLSTVCMSEEKKDLDFFPLTVEYQERYYAAGKILGSRYIRRETRPSEEAICTSRLIDRAIRPLFPENLKREVQVVATCLSWDKENDPDLLGLLGASLSLSISDIPWEGPVGAVRVARVNDKFILNPTYAQREESSLDLVLAGVKENKEIIVNMLEGEGEEVEESLILEAFEFAKPYLEELISFQNQIKKEIGKEKIKIEAPQIDPSLEKEMRKILGKRLEKAIYQADKLKRAKDIENLEEELVSFVEGKYPGQGNYAKDFIKKEQRRIVHENTILKGIRPDGRKPTEIREITAEAGFLPRTHGSGLFCRGLTKALSILTLGPPGDQKLLEGMEISGKKRFMHHYNFPPYSAGEVKPIRGPSRRDIGHGMLVEKALFPLIPCFSDFPYTIRVVSEILSSNGSTSMASVSSSSLALMDAGVPIKRPAAGIAVGLMADPNSSIVKSKFRLLTDIQGPEDHLGDMDFKVAGTEKGITAIQMDVKIRGITKTIFKEALEAAREARLKIINKIKGVLEKPREKLSPYAPKIATIQINPEKIGMVVGPRGTMINEIIEKCEVSIDIQPSGLIFVSSGDSAGVKKAIEWIKNITKEVKVGEVFQGRVKKILNFGAFVEILPGQEGLVHISQLAPWRVKRVEDIVKVGDIIPVKVISIDDQGRINLSIKETGFIPNKKTYGKKSWPKSGQDNG